ncbi:sodium channel protein Nach-like [Sitodiplosis mosellana]|uniref:sodium channel protein Nach-like n=1 Tax=Sitodiplosis mosellana TaxID=263140 RepID=UPI002443E105|nr:sodium channel protein Nach-like [Sitodiplosis mosellana]
MKETNQKSSKSTFKTCLLKTTNEYISVSSITGLKVFWSLILILSFIFCNILVAHFWLRYKSNSTRMTVASNHLPLPTLRLPKIAFCPITHIDSHRLSIFMDTIKFEHSRENISRMFEQSSGFFTTIAYDVNELKVLQNIVDTNRYLIQNVMDMVQTSCDDVFVRCRFEGKPINCSDLFQPSTSQYGLCCIFNKRSYYNNSWAPDGRTSMSLLLRPSPKTFISSESARFLVYESNTSASTSLFESTLARSTENWIDIIPEVNMCSEDVGQTPIDQRNCLYEWERQLKYFAEYRELNCKLECILTKIESACHCLPYYFSMYSKSTKICDFLDIKCLTDKYWSTYNQEKNDTKNCECMPNCVEISYQAVTSQSRLQPNYFDVGSFYRDLSEEHLVVHISFGKQVFKAIQKELATNVLSLTANLGGIYSLFIGFSAISFYEIIYYFCVRFYLNYKRDLTASKPAKR